MKKEERHGYPTVNSFVKARIASFNNTEHTFAALFELMFTETDRLFYEKSEGARIIRTTFGEAKDETLRRADKLNQELVSVPKGAIVGLYMDNSLSWIEMFWSLLLCGYRPLLMNLRLDEGTLTRALSDCDAAAVIAEKGAPQFPVRTIYENDITPSDDALVSAGSGSEILVMSSGSTGNLKLCAYGPEEFFLQVRSSIDIIRKMPLAKRHYDGYLKQLCFLPFYHIFGLVAVYIWFAFFSCAFVELRDLSPDTIVSTIRRHNVTHIFAVPLFWEKVYDKAIAGIKARGDDVFKKFQKGMRIADKTGDIPVIGKLFSLIAFREVRAQIFGRSPKFFITGGSEIPTEVLSFFNNIGYHIANGYGMSEVGITSLELSSKRSVLCSGSVGSPIPQIEYAISDEGELLIKSSSAAKYIIENGEIHKRSEWFATGDLAGYEHGLYKILGRKDDIVISRSGENINPVIVESSFNLSGIRRTALINTEKDGRLEPMLMISVAEGLDADGITDLRNRVQEKLAALKLSGEIHKVFYTADDLLGEEDFKLNRRRIASRYAAGRYRDLTEGPKDSLDDTISEGELFDIVRAKFAETLARDPGTIHDNFDFFIDGEGTSLDYLAMIAELEDDFDYHTPEDMERSPVTVREFVEFIAKVTDQIEQPQIF